MMHYRQIFEEQHGAIPKDSDGRTFDIHHIDGNHQNNDVNNLIAVSIKEHYDIHYSRGDYAACLLIDKRMKFPVLSSEERSKLSTMHNLRRSANGTNPFLDGEVARKSANARVANGTHNWLGSEHAVKTNKKKIENGTHHLLTRADGSSLSKDRVNNKTHHLLRREDGSSLASDRVKSGTHHLVTNNPSKIKVTCPHCQKLGGFPNMKRYHFENCKLRKIQ
jgi:hypothetical protein